MLIPFPHASVYPPTGQEDTFYANNDAVTYNIYFNKIASKFNNGVIHENSQLPFKVDGGILSGDQIEHAEYTVVPPRYFWEIIGDPVFTAGTYSFPEVASRNSQLFELEIPDTSEPILIEQWFSKNVSYRYRLDLEFNEYTSYHSTIPTDFAISMVDKPGEYIRKYFHGLISVYGDATNPKVEDIIFGMMYSGTVFSGKATIVLNGQIIYEEGLYVPARECNFQFDITSFGKVSSFGEKDCKVNSYKLYIGKDIEATRNNSKKVREFLYRYSNTTLQLDTFQSKYSQFIDRVSTLEEGTPTGKTFVSSKLMMFTNPGYYFIAKSRITSVAQKYAPYVSSTQFYFTVNSSIPEFYSLTGEFFVREKKKLDEEYPVNIVSRNAAITEVPLTGMSTLQSNSLYFCRSQNDAASLHFRSLGCYSYYTTSAWTFFLTSQAVNTVYTFELNGLQWSFQSWYNNTSEPFNPRYLDANKIIHIGADGYTYNNPNQYFEFPGVFGFYNLQTDYAYARNEPRSLEMWFDENQNSVEEEREFNYSGITYIAASSMLLQGGITSSSGVPNIHANDYVSKLRVGVFKKDTNMSNPSVSDVIYGAVYDGTLSGGTFYFALNGEKIQEETLTQRVISYKLNLSTAAKTDPKNPVPNAPAGAVLELWNSYSGTTLINLLSKKTWVLADFPSAFFDSYDIKVAKYVHEYAQNGVLRTTERSSWKLDTKMFTSPFVFRGTPYVPDILEYKLISGPDGMTVDPITGKCEWKPITDGEFPVVVEMRSNNTSSKTQEFVAVSSYEAFCGPHPVQTRPVSTAIQTKGINANFVLPAVSAGGALTTGHGDFPPQAALSGSPNVIINGCPAVRAGDEWPGHSGEAVGTYEESNLVFTRNRNVLVNGLPLVTAGDIFDCGDVCDNNSSGILVGGDASNSFTENKALLSIAYPKEKGTTSPYGAVYVDKGDQVSIKVTQTNLYLLDTSLTTGDCPAGVWEGDMLKDGFLTYTTGPIIADCSIVFGYTRKLSITPFVIGNGTVTPYKEMGVDNSTQRIRFTVTPDEGYMLSPRFDGSHELGGWDNAPVYPNDNDEFLKSIKTGYWEGNDYVMYPPLEIDRVIVFRFIKIAQQVTVSQVNTAGLLEDKATVTPSGIVDVNYGETLAISVIPEEGYYVEKIPPLSKIGYGFWDGDVYNTTPIIREGFIKFVIHPKKWRLTVSILGDYKDLMEINPGDQLVNTGHSKVEFLMSTGYLLDFSRTGGSAPTGQISVPWYYNQYYTDTQYCKYTLDSVITEDCDIEFTVINWVGDLFNIPFVFSSTWGYRSIPWQRAVGLGRTGGDAVRSGPLHTPITGGSYTETNSMSTLNITELGTISFWYRSDMHAYADFYFKKTTGNITTTLLNVSGIGSWTYFSHAVVDPARPEIDFMWSYGQYAQYLDGNNCVYVDDITWTPLPYFSVTPSIPNGHGTVTPNTPLSVQQTVSGVFTVIPEAGYYADPTVTGTAPVGTWSGDVYTTGAISGNCTVIFNFLSIITKEINISVLNGHGTVNSSVITVPIGETVEIECLPDDGYIPSLEVGGTPPAGGVWSGHVYRTGIITEDCSLIFTFEIGVISNSLNQALDNTDLTFTAEVKSPPDRNFWSIDTHEYYGSGGSSVLFSGMEIYDYDGITVEFTGPGIFSFWYKTDCYDDLTWNIDGVVTRKWGVNPWTQFIYTTYDNTAHSAYFEFRKAEIANNEPFGDRAWIDNVVWAPKPIYTVTAAFISVDGDIVPSTVETIGEGGTKIIWNYPLSGYYTSLTVEGNPPIGGSFDGTGRKYTTGPIYNDCVLLFRQIVEPLGPESFSAAAGSNYNLTVSLNTWVIDPTGGPTGGACVRTAENVSDSSSNTLSLTTQTPGTISFKYKTSTEYKCDYLVFRRGYYDYYLYASGEVDWTEVSYYMPFGGALTWAYNKDIDGFAGQDCVWLSDITFTPDYELEVDVNVSSTAHGSVTPNGKLHLTNETLVLEVNPDADYIPVISNPNGIPMTWFGDLLVLSPISSNISLNIDFVLGNVYLIVKVGPNGTITPNQLLTVLKGVPTVFTAIPDPNYVAVVSPVSSTPVGHWIGTEYTTGIIESLSTIEFEFVHSDISIISTSGANGTISNLGELFVLPQTTISYRVTPNSGYAISTVSGTAPAGTWNGDVYTTGTITENCTINFSFAATYSEQISQSIGFLPFGDYYHLPTSYGEGPSWYVQSAMSHSGGSAARSGHITESVYGDSYLAHRLLGPGTISFWWKVSCRTNYDSLRLYLDAVEITSITGEVDWTLKSYVIPSGVHEIKWQYHASSSYNVGESCGWVDDVIWTPS